MVVNAEQWDLIDTDLHSPGAPIRRAPAVVRRARGLPLVALCPG